ncbi:hypothetical protein Nepgr_024151 [Nepenthes gracilis]|uniref:Pentatricopeptide repeat-containing protein n=1 Tax=Nepenthes gracilis TaxID=150966 RepID=A0AAD3T285_NEPGR|nr:hypothetical protein Nepgr_024151 [Nepenthes gracilis]
MPRGCPEEALWLFLLMNRSGFFPNEVTFASVLGSCAAVLELCLSRQIHGRIVKCGFLGNVILESSLVDVYGKCGIMSEARRMFDEVENPNAVSWNVIVRRYLEVGDEEAALCVFFEMIYKGVRSLTFTFSNALVACSRISALGEGTQIHGVAVKINYEEDEVVSSSLIDMYVKCGNLDGARKIFDQPSSKNLISWTSIVSGYAMCGRTKEARELFNEMPERSIVSWNAMLTGYTQFCQWEDALNFIFLMIQHKCDVDHVTLGLILNVCAGLSNVEFGKQVHGYSYRHGFYSNVSVGNALLDMYGKCGCLRCSRIWFYQMSDLRDTISWNSLMTSYASHHLSQQVITIFTDMQRETAPNKYTFATLLAACADIFALKQGKQIHGFIIRNDYAIDDVLLGALVSIYSKCHLLDYALKVFKEADPGDVVLWNSMILGCCRHDKGMEALQLFGLMKQEGVKPDHVTFLAILHACICGGYVELGGKYFDLMSSEYCLMARLEHYECMIELYTRHGVMDELKQFVKTLPFDPTIPMLTRISDACRKYGDSTLGKWAAKKIESISSCNGS